MQKKSEHIFEIQNIQKCKTQQDTNSLKTKERKKEKETILHKNIGNICIYLVKVNLNQFRHAYIAFVMYNIEKGQLNINFFSS